MTLFNQHVGFDGWMQSSAVMKKKSWNVALVTWRVVSRKDESYYADSAEDDDGLDGWAKELISLAKEGVLQRWTTLGYSSQITQQRFSSNQEYTMTQLSLFPRYDPPAS
ncbi:predicted protein [Lichtheimia corymbifera JMRC:FSU:9682]|uniref:Uncharacterized protein n=1 Tax=Lichtheimia corymbifera JMRC:FSU:9682 TaxID=1263082 RepID=A0A068RKB9_9FUNG|nr:predicted protein [Lichtheimia corymbifera JMRC:FSU:9682]